MGKTKAGKIHRKEKDSLNAENSLQEVKKKGSNPPDRFNIHILFPPYL